MNPEVSRAAQILRAGGLVAFPTETVYGLGADASNPAAIARLYTVKRRPHEHPVIVHFADTQAAFAWARELPERARKLAERFWPADSYQVGMSPPSFDKQYVREYLETLDWNKAPPAPKLPAEVIRKTSEKYREALQRLTGRKLA